MNNISRRAARGGDVDGQYACVVVCGLAATMGPEAATVVECRKLYTSVTKSNGAACNQGTCNSQGKRHGRVVCRAAIVRSAAFRTQRLQGRHTRRGAPDIRQPLATCPPSPRPALGPMPVLREVRGDLIHHAASCVAASRRCDTTASTMPGRSLISSRRMASLMVSLR